MEVIRPLLLKFTLDLIHKDTKIFITQKMKDDYKNGLSPSDILAERKALILQSEREFVESFELKYIEKE